MLKRSPQLSRFLTYVVTDSLESQGSGLKEYEIARKVLNKPSDFDVRLDPIVRVEARRLRARLNDYYAGEGREDSVLIDLGKRGYRPNFTQRTEKVAEPAIPAIQPVSEGTAIAVLPFADMTEDGNHEYFCDGLTEELIHALTRVPGLHVASRSSAFQFKGTGQDIRKVGAELGVVAVMEGSLRRDGKRLRVTAQLTNASTGFHLWSETYDTELEDLFDVQEKISNAIVDTVRQQRQLPVTLLLQRRQSEHPEAYRRFLQGLQLLRSPLRADLLRSESLLAGAVEADPDYAAAYAALARARVKLIWNELRAPQDGWLLVKSAAERTLELDPASGLAHAALGSAHAAHDWNWPEAEKRFDQALKSGSCEAAVQQAWAVQYLSPLKKLDEALSAAALAAESAPDSLEAWHDLACIRFYRREYGEASSQFRTLLAGKPDYVDALLGLARCHLEMKEFQKALATAQLAVAVEDNSKAAAVAIMCLAAAGQGQEAGRLARTLEKKQQSQYVSPVVFALAAVSLQQYDEAVKQLEAALHDRSVRLIEIDLDPAYDPLRSRGLLEPFRASVCLPTATN
ncbi:MAG: tetratricopeptide repeat protein [Acidobacteriota bacterium]